MSSINYISKGHPSYPKCSGGYIKVGAYLMWTGNLNQSTSKYARFKVLNWCVKGPASCLNNEEKLKTVVSFRMKTCRIFLFSANKTKTHTHMKAEKEDLLLSSLSLCTSLYCSA